MRRIVPPVPRHSSYVRILSGVALAAVAAITSLQAQKPYPGRNVNVMSGLSLPDGDPYLQRQNEPSVAASTRNPMHLLGGSNDYRTVDIPGLNCVSVDPTTGECLDPETRDAWVGLFKSVDGGQRWKSTLHPGFQQDDSTAGLSSPLKAYQAGADAVVRAGTHGLIYYSGLVFDRDKNGKSGVFLSRFIDNNNLEAGDPFAFLGTTLVARAPAGSVFLDKPWLAVDIPRGNPAMCSVSTTDIVPTNQPGTKTGKKATRQAVKGGRKGSAANPQQVPAGAVYVAYTAFSGEGTGRGAQIWISRSLDCGKTWGDPIRVSRTEDQLNQGSNIAIDPRNGNVYVAYRRFDPNYSDTNDLDAMMVARVPFNNKKADTAAVVKKFPKPKTSGRLDPMRITEHRGGEHETVAKPGEAEAALEQFDLDDRDTYSFRSLAYPTMAIDGTGRVYVAWTQRGFASDPVVINGTLNSNVGARVVMTTSLDGKAFTPLQVVDDHTEPGRGHQLMPSMTFAGGKLMLIFYDMRETRAISQSGAGVHTSRASDIDKSIRHTIDIRSVMGTPGDIPRFSPSEKVSDYLMGINPRTDQVEQLQVNPPNLPMFKKGTAPFMGDYIDVAAAPAFIPLPNGKWIYNANDTGVTPVFHAVWTDNRDVRPPSAKKLVNGKMVPDWTKYTPAKVTDNEPPRTSFLDGSIVPECRDDAANAGTRNQNVYSSRISTDGLIAGSPGNAKPLSMTLQRGFVVFATNTTSTTKSYRMTVLSQPPGGRASFNQFPLPPFTAASPLPETAIELIVPGRSTAARTVYVTSTDPDARINVDVSELPDLTVLPPDSYPIAVEVPGGAGTTVFINPDVENPDVENPDVENPDVENPDVENAEVYNPDVENPDVENPDVENPDVENPDVENPDVENPDVENPDVENPDVENVRVANPDVENPDVENPDVENPDVENPDVENPDVENPDVENGAISDITWKVTNTGNTTASFNVNLFLAQQQLPLGVQTQLILLKTYRTPVTEANGCELGFQVRNIILANIPNPQLVVSNGTVSDPNDPRPTNATMWLAPGEQGRIVLRLVDETPLEDRVQIPKLDESGAPVLNEDGSQKFVTLPQGLTPSENVTSVVQQQSVNTEEAEEGVIEPPVVPSFPAPQATTDVASTAELTPVTINVLANDSTAFGSTKVISLHPVGMAAHSGGFPGDITYQPATGYVYTQRGIVDPATNALVGRLGAPSPTENVAYQQANPRTGINYQRTSQPNGALSALDARPDSTTFHHYLPMPVLADAVLAFGMDTVHHKLYVLHGENTQTLSSRTWFSAIDIDPSHVVPSTDTPRHDLLYTIALPANLRGNAVAVNTRTQQVYLGISGMQGGVNSGGVYVVDGTSPAPAATRVPNTSTNYGIAINESSNQVFAASSYLSGPSQLFQLDVIDGATLAVATIQTPELMRFSNHDERLIVHEASSKAFMRLGSSVVVIDGRRGSATRNTVVATIPVGADANNGDIAIDQQLGRVITVGQFDYRADVIDVATNTLVGGVPLPIGGTDVAVDPVSHVAFVSTMPTSLIKVDLTGVAPPVTIPVFIESSRPAVNPVTNRTYVSATSDASGIGIVSGAGVVGTIGGITGSGRYLSSARQVSTNRFFFIHSGNQSGTSSGPGTVVVVDGATDGVIKQLDTLPQPFGIGIDQTAAKIYVASTTGNIAHGGVRIFNADDLDAAGVDATFTTTTSAAAGAFPMNSPNALLAFGRHVVVNPIDHRIYVMQLGGSDTSVAVLDPITNVLTPLDGGPGTTLFDYQQSVSETWGRANIIRVSPSLNRIIIGFDRNGSDNRIVVLDGTTHQVLHNIIAGGHSGRHTSNYIVLDEAMQRMFVSDYAGNVVSIFDTATLAPLQVVGVPAGPDALAINLTTHRLYVSSIDTKMLTALDYTAASLAMSSSVHLPLVAYFMNVDEVESRIYTSGGDSADESGVMVVTDILGQLGTNVSVTGVSGAAKGAVVLNSDYSVTYTPYLGQSGMDSFTYDIAAPTGTATGTVTINIAPSNPTSVSFGDAYATSYNTPLGVDAPGPLTNDAPGTGPVAMVLDETTTHGLLSPAADGSFVYTPNAGFAGTDAFTYHTTSTLGASNVSTVTITVSQPNELAVTTTADSGAGSLRSALSIASSEPNSVIKFNIPGAGPHVIQPATPLPVVTAPVTIDGYTQNGATPNTAAVGTSAVIKIVINGSSAGSGANGLYLQGGSSTVRGLAIGGFSDNGILMDTAGNNIIAGNFIGTTASGTAASANGQGGVTSKSPNNQIGTAALEGRNLISGNADANIRVSQLNVGTSIISNGAGAVIVNNLIGTDASGLAALSTTPTVGIAVNAPNVVIGGTSVPERNVIAGNNGTGIGSSAATTGSPLVPYNFPTNLVVQGNYIGLDAAGGLALTNKGGGVNVTGANSLIGGTAGTTVGACTGACNIISGNTGSGISVGTQFEDPQSMPNPVLTPLGTIYSQATGTQVIGNFVGVNPAGGSTAMTNGSGIKVSAPNVTIGGNVVAASSSGIAVTAAIVQLTNALVADSAGSVVKGNYVGLNAAGTVALTGTGPAIDVTSSNVTVGGPGPNDGNYAVAGLNSGGQPSPAVKVSRQLNGGNQVVNTPTNVTVQGNIIGLFTDGTRSNMRGSGISVNTSSNVVLDNRIAGLGTGAMPTVAALSISGFGSVATSNAVKGNTLGVNLAGTVVKNWGAGITIGSSSNNTIGGTTAAERNVVVAQSETAMFVSGSPATPSNNNIITGNYFGVMPDGLTAAGNTGGVQIYSVGTSLADANRIGGSTTGERNIIASSVLGSGISLFGAGTTNTVVRGNYVGVAADGTTARGNAGGIVLQDASLSSIGGPDAADGNLIANNNGPGVSVVNASAVRNSILNNRIFGNTSLGIDLGDNGVTNNDAGDTDTGPNSMQNFPVLTGASNSNGNTTTIDADLSTFVASETFLVQFFVSNSCATPQGEQFAGSATLTSAGGTNIALNQLVSMNQHITATATDSQGNTSEFSACVQVQPPTVVTNTNDSGAGSLRDAINYTNAQNTSQTITFNIPGTVTPLAPAIINLVTALPAVIKGTMIDATTQPGWAALGTATPLVVVDGQNAPGATGLVINGAGATIRGLSIVRFPQNGMTIAANNVLLQGNFIGVYPDGSTAGANGIDGIVVTGAINLIGGTIGGHRNVVSGNVRDGIRVVGAGAGNAIVGNLIGTNAQGSSTLGNGRNGVTLEQSTGVTVGGNTAQAQNLISGNGQHGVHVFVCDAGRFAAGLCNGHTIEGNRIGTDVNGNFALRNNQHGVYIEAAANNTVKNNLISGNTLDGVNVYSNSLTLAANQTIVGNYIGTGANGNSPLANQRHGVAFVGPVGSRLGGTVVTERNVISYNQGVGVDLENTTDITVQGNYIGITANGTGTAGNAQQGVLVYSNVANLTLGGATASAGNVISSNQGAGVHIGNGSHDNLIRNNIIGWDPTGTNPRGNSLSGIYLDGPNNTIQENRIANNVLNGVRAVSGTGSRITQNRIENNGLLGIDLGNDGVTTNDANDGDTGPNNRQNYPVLTSVSSSGNDTTIVGTLNSTPNSSFTMEFFLNSAADSPGGFGEGAQYLAMLPANTDASGNFNFSAAMQNIVTAPGQWVSATATNNVTGDTSEFSLSEQVDNDLVVVSGADFGSGTLRAAIDSANSMPGTQTIRFAFPNSPALITLTSSLPGITDAVLIDGKTQPGYTNSPLIEITSGTPGSFVPFNLNADNIVVRGFSITKFATGIYAMENRGGHTIEDNIIGTHAGIGAGNGNGIGIDWRAHQSTIRNNAILGNTGDGLLLHVDGSSNQIQNNKIGVAPNGVTQLANAGNGVAIYDGAVGNTFSDNIISANTGWGVNIQSVGATASGNSFFSNKIGVDFNGNDAGNFGGGLRLENAPGTVVGQPGQGNTISGNGGNNAQDIGVGVLVLGSALPWPTIRSNYIGLDPTGVFPRSNNNKGLVLEGPAVVGGMNVADRNYISGNGDIAGGAGIMVGTGGGGANIQGNVIGLNVNGDSAVLEGLNNVSVGNGYAGITVRSSSAITIGGGNAGQGNVLSGNGAWGISVLRTSLNDPVPSGADIQGNMIGTDVTGTLVRGNALGGINAAGNNLLIGGATANLGNTIVNNGSAGGVKVNDSVFGVRIERNAIRDNGGLGIDVEGDGVTANDFGDGDGGSNGRQNFPVLWDANNNLGNTQVSYHANGFAGGQYTLNFYSSSVCDASGNGEGGKWLASTVINSGASSSLSLNQVVPGGHFITATATDALGNTSEFSACAQVMLVFMVTNADESGPGSLADAITQANAMPGYQTINFNIPGAGPNTPAVIALTSSLPIITGPIIISAESQPGWDGKPVVELNGQGVVARGFETLADVAPVTIRGFAITRFTSAGIYFMQTDSSGSGNTVVSNYIGTNRNNGNGLGNGTGILTRSDWGNIIANVISGNTGAAVVLENDADNVTIQQNTIGLNGDQVATLSNGTGIVIYGSENNTIIDNNIISGNIGWGIDLQATADQVFGTEIRRNTIGLDKDGNDAGNGINNPPGGGGGIRINGGPGTLIGGQPAYRNVISGNGGPNSDQVGIGILIEGNLSPYPVIKSNYIGLDPTGIWARGNLHQGIWLNSQATIGGPGANDRNFISGNGTIGGANGVGGAGIMVGVSAGGSYILGNTIGLNVNNDVVGNGSSGIHVRATSPVFIGGNIAAEGNVISGNGAYGINVERVGGDPFPSGTVIKGNRIGTDLSETLSRGNVYAGIGATGNNLQIGGAGVGEGNVISRNLTGIRVDDVATRVRIERNSIDGNTVMGIDLGGDNVSANDPGDIDAGANNRQNFPVLSNANNASNPTQVTHDTSSFAVGTYTLDFYVSPACDANGHGEGKTWVASTSAPNAGPTNFALGQVVPNGYVITATATDSLGNTSEFSPCALIADQGIVTNQNDDGAGSLRDAITYSNNTPGTQTIQFQIPGVNAGSPALIYAASPMPALTQPVNIDGTTQSGWDGLPVVEVRGFGAGANAPGFYIQSSNVTIRGLAITGFQEGVQTDQNLTGLLIERNIIGSNRSFIGDIGNGVGIMYGGDNSTIRQNDIVGNGEGLVMRDGASGNSVLENGVGMSQNGSILRGNNGHGIVMYDGANNNTIDSNFISGNNGYGVDMQLGGALVTGTKFWLNYIGLNASGNAVSNALGGIHVNKAPGTEVGNPTHPNFISGNNGHGLLIEGGDVSPIVQVVSNFIGLDPSGNLDRGNQVDGVHIGQATDALIYANVISGNNGSGVQVSVSSSVPEAVIRANIIGLNAAGNTAVPNADSGVLLTGAAADIGGTTVNDRNIISGNLRGITVNNSGSAFNTLIRGNYIGTGVNGIEVLGNTGEGILVLNAPSTVIGAWNGGNTIVNNGGRGIAVQGNLPGIRIETNAIYANGDLGIDIGGNGVTPNDQPDLNGVQNFPEISNANNTTAATTYATLDTNALVAGTYLVEFFKSATCDASGHGEGAASLIRFGITAQTGLAQLNLNSVVPNGWFVSALATSDAPGSHTSEFSACVQVTGPSVSGTIAYSATPLSGVTVKLVQGSPTDPPLATTTTLGDGSYQFLNVAAGNYFVRADGPDSSFIDWGATGTTVTNANVNVSIQLPKKITLLTPADPSTDITAKPTLTWTGIAEATRYVIQINHTNTWTPIDPGAESLTTSYTVQTLLTGSENYTWQVDAYDAANRNVGSTTNAFHFTVIAPIVVNVAGTSGGLNNPNFPGTGTWATLGAILGNGEKVWISATGGVTFCNTCGAVDPNGWVPNTADGQSLVPGQIIASLVASINGSPWSFVGTGPTLMTAVGGGVQLLLAVNDSDYNDNGGSWTVTIQK